MYISNIVIIYCVICSCKADPIYNSNGNPTKPPLRQESLNWGNSYEDPGPIQTPATSLDLNKQTQTNPLERNPVIIWRRDKGAIETADRSHSISWQTVNQTPPTESWDGLTCPKGATGQFPYIYDCRKFLNCWKGRGMPMVCAAGTLFNPQTLECDYPSKVNCLDHRQYQGIKAPSHLPTSQSGVQNLPDQTPEQTSSVNQHSGVQPPYPNINPTGFYPQYPTKTYSTTNQYDSYGRPVQNFPAQHFNTDNIYVNPVYVKPPVQNPYDTHNNNYSTLYYQKPRDNQGKSYQQSDWSLQQSFNTEQIITTADHQNFSEQNIQLNTNKPPGYHHQGNNYSSVRYQKPYVSPLPSFQESDSFIPSQTFNTNRTTNVENGQNFSQLNKEVLNSNISAEKQIVPQTSYGSDLIEEGTEEVTSSTSRPKCPRGYSGLYPHPECNKFFSCSHGTSFVMTCANGTRFHPRMLVCDYPYKVQCTNDGLHVTYNEDVQPVSNNHPDDLVAYPSEIFQDVEVDLGLDVINETEEDFELSKNKSSQGNSAPWLQIAITTPQPYMPHPDNKQIKGFFITNSTPIANVKQSKSLPTYIEAANYSKPSKTNENSTLNTNPTKTSKVPPKVKEESVSKFRFFNQINSTSKPESHIFRPNNSILYSGVKYNGTLLTNRQVLRLRGGPTHLEGFVEIQLSQGTWGLVCDRQNQWSLEEANIVCRNLGFSRGAEVSWQGKATDHNKNFSRIISTDSVKCYGHEQTILECSVSRGSVCDIGRDAVWVRCYSNPVSQCMPGETLFEEKCYSLVIPTEDTTSSLVGFSQGEALAHCQRIGGRLLDITSQKENDYLSEWLLRQDSVDSIMTSGVGVSVMKHSLWIWEGSEDSFAYHNWWPGWQGGTSVPPETQTGRALCVVARRLFSCPNLVYAKEPQICDAQYYFWDVEDCGSMSNKYSYVCERPADKVGCSYKNGESYLGNANITQKGTYCLPWDTSEVLTALQYRISETDYRNKLQGHNYCRNIGGKDIQPWCYTQLEDGISKEHCDIPECSHRIEKSGQYLNNSCSDSGFFPCNSKKQCIPRLWVCDGEKDCTDGKDEQDCPNDEDSLLESSTSAGIEVLTQNRSNNWCRDFEFSCNFEKQCIPQMWVCDGEEDCPNGRDEMNCTVLEQFSNIKNSRLIGHDVEKWQHTPFYSCAQHCNDAKDFVCRSFSFSDKLQTCVLSDSNIGLSGSLAINESLWSYYEMTSRSLECNDMFECENGKCINVTGQCNGHNDCGDRSDERNCSWNKYGIELRLTGGNHSNEGMIEMKVLGEWGLICDDQFDSRDGDVICRHLGFPLGASELRKHSDFNTNINAGTKYFIDDLQCRGNETNILECEHNGWGVHNCGPDEAAGVICRIEGEDCGFNYWQCEKIRECIPLGYLCDNVQDCTDKTDEDTNRCNAPILFRLVGHGRSNKGSEGRLEVQRFGIWGTVCDDDFGTSEAEVVCNSLGYAGPAKAVKEAAYGPGNGVIWLDQVHCSGNETTVADCMHESWGQTNCRHNEDVSVSCFPNLKNMEKGKNRHHSKKFDKKWSLKEILPSKCGVPPEINTSALFMPKVVSGFETLKGSYPWQASIRVKSISGRSSHWCGAVIISKLHVLTAGHCLRDYIKATYFIRAGDYDTEVHEETEQDLEIEEIWIHPDIDKFTRLNNDLALVKLKNPGFTFNEWITAACLPQAMDKYTPDNNCTISGWGSNGKPGSGFARTLHATWLNILPVNECKADFVYGDSAITEGMFCAGSLKGGADSCQGDSGGPFLCLNRGQYTVYGITSWGHGCGRANAPGVYTKVTYYMDWIHNKILKSMTHDN